MNTNVQTRGNVTQRVYDLAFAFAIVLLLCVFGLVLPLAGYFSKTFMTTYDLEMPKLALLAIQLSPWSLILIAIVGATTLIAKESWWSAPIAFRVNIATITAVVVVGGLLALALLNPIHLVMQALSH